MVATEALLVLRDNLADVVAAKAMMCVHGDAGLGKTLSVNASLRALAPADVCRVILPGLPPLSPFFSYPLPHSHPRPPLPLFPLKTPCLNGSGSWSV